MKIADYLPATYTRVQEHTPPAINEQIQNQMTAEVRRLAEADNEAITARLRQLDSEWDTDRVMETNEAVAMLLGLLLGATVNRKVFAFSGFVAVTLLMFALLGWNPPAALWRRLRVRTPGEISTERTALRILRRDFQPTTEATEAFAQARR